MNNSPENQNPESREPQRLDEIMKEYYDALNRGDPPAPQNPRHSHSPESDARAQYWMLNSVRNDYEQRRLAGEAVDEDNLQNIRNRLDELTRDYPALLDPPVE